MWFRGFTVTVTTVLVVTGIAGSAHADTPATKPKITKLQVTSTAFADHKPIPEGFTCDGAGASPPLQYANVPKSAKDRALIVTDPDVPSGTIVHWIAWHLPKGGLPEQNVPPGVVQGKNTLGNQGWNAPCPPRGSAAHHYVFTVYAVSKPIGLAPGASADELRAAIKGNVVGQGKLVGTDQRP